VSFDDGSLQKHAALGKKYEIVVFYCNTAFAFKSELTFTGKSFFSHLHS